MQPLKGLKVIDLTKVLAGPLCGQYLGEYGADVIKVETTDFGDETRRWLPQDQGESAVFLAVNHNKRSLALDLKTAEGKKVIHELVKYADIVLQGYGGGTAKKLEVDYETLSSINPHLIYCEISGYGRTGPMGNEPGYDVMLQAFGGMLSTMGSEGNYARASFSPVDIGTAMNGLSGVLAAVLERQQTGKGVYLEISLLDTALGFMTYMAQSYWRTGVNPKPMGTAHPSMSPYQAFDASDGTVMIGAGNDAQWKRFCAVAGLDEYVDHPDYATNAIRIKNLPKTQALVQDVIRKRTVNEWVTMLSKAKVPCAPIQNLGQALDHPQVASRGLFVHSDHTTLGPLKNIGHSVRFQNKDRKAVRPPPLHGEHSDAILYEAGFSSDYIKQLKQSGTVKQHQS